MDKNCVKSILRNIALFQTGNFVHGTQTVFSVAKNMCALLSNMNCVAHILLNIKCPRGPTRGPFVTANISSSLYGRPIWILQMLHMYSTLVVHSSITKTKAMVAHWNDAQ